jgi:aminoglycoside phosphotransferase (APT) family kinase protein
MSDERPRTSTRDRNELRRQLLCWLEHQVDAPEVSELTVPPTNGMSSETVMFDASWNEGSGRRAQPCVLRLPPDASAAPVFPRYDMERQYRAMQLAADRALVPVPPLLWLEADPSPLGAPFFVMARVDGLVPPDVMPYPFGDNWLFDATPAEQAALQQHAIEVLARLHAVDLGDEAASFLTAGQEDGNSPLRRHVDEQRAYYDWVVADGVRSPVLEQAFDWLEAHWPGESDTVLSWGDARIGNIMFRRFEPVAVLDWEMVGVGPREIDLAWMIFMHRFFQDLVEQLGMPGMPSFMRCDEVAEAYTALTGVVPRDLQWFLVYAAVRLGAVMFRIARRHVLFGEAAMADDPDDMITHRRTIEQMLDGTYWARL